MLHILLLILKIIGIVILCLLGVLVLGIACALFVPVRYRVEAVRKEGEGEPPVILRVKVTWLLHFINFALRFDGSLFVRARIILFTLFRLPKKEGRIKKEKRKTKKSAEPEETAGDEVKREETGKNTAKEQAESAETTTGKQEKRESASQAGLPGGAAQTETPDGGEGRRDEQETAAEEKTPSDKPSFVDKIRAVPEILRGVFSKIKGLFENIQYTIRKFCDKIKSVSDTIEYYRDVIEGENFRRSFALCKGELLRIGKSLKPQKFQAKLIVGTDDPASTGQILAYCGMLYPLLGGYVDVAGDFEKKRLEGQVLVKGKIRFFTFLRVAVRVYFNKDIRKLYRLLKKEAV